MIGKKKDNFFAQCRSGILLGWNRNLLQLQADTWATNESALEVGRKISGETNDFRWFIFGRWARRTRLSAA